VTETTGGASYYLEFVEGPGASGGKAKVPLSFDKSSTISIGRNAENVVVIPDQEISRKHAELSMKGSKVMVRDLNSTNGTFVQNGKKFEKVSGSVEVKPNGLVRFGKSTTVKLTKG